MPAPGSSGGSVSHVSSSSCSCFDCSSSPCSRTNRRGNHVSRDGAGRRCELRALRRSVLLALLIAVAAELQLPTLGRLAPVQARFAPTEVLLLQATRRKLAATYRSRIHHVLAAIDCRGKLRNETLNKSRRKTQRKTSKKLYLRCDGGGVRRRSGRDELHRSRRCLNPAKARLAGRPHQHLNLPSLPARVSWFDLGID